MFVSTNASVRQFKETVELRSPIHVRVRNHRYFPFALLGGALLFVAFVHIWQRVQVIELAKEVGKLRTDSQSLLDGTKKLNSEISALSMASHIQRFASKSLGMQAVTADKLFTLVDSPAQTADQKPDQFALMVSSLKRLVDYLPATAEVQAVSNDLRPVVFDTSVTGVPDK